LKFQVQQRVTTARLDIIKIRSSQIAITRLVLFAFKQAKFKICWRYKVYTSGSRWYRAL